MIIEGKNEELGTSVYLEVSSIEFNEQGNIINFNAIANLDVITDFDGYTDWRFRVFR